ncbi:MAG: FAD-dependent oxidoreductase [Planctomycetia bacterium]|nr:FAD-dependent oxidoreductase [Planctomycetia bacterium]
MTFKFKTRLLAIGFVLASLLHSTPPAPAAPPERREYDIVVYGGTAGGVAAAVQGARMGKSVLLVEPGRHIGGLTSGGLGATDIGNKAAIGGIAREFYRRLGAHYADDKAWTHQRRAEFKGGLAQTGEAEMWTFEPHVAENVLRAILKEAGVTVVFERRLKLADGVQNSEGRIAAITTEDGDIYAGKMFIDATYEGDLLAKAGVVYTVGREANAQYGETLNGVQTAHAMKHQFLKPVDPFLKRGDASSGLLPGIHAGEPGRDGEADRRVQAYNFRMCLTDAPENRLPFPKPAGYDPLRYELLLRYIESGVFDAFCSNLPMPNRKSDCNNCGAFSTDNIGMNYDYPEGDYAGREKIFQEHVVYQQGLMWFLANDPRVPQTIRDQIGRWGLCRDEFQETGGWPHQLYIREARRMVGAYVMTQHNCQGRATADDYVGLAAYTMDSHNTQRYVKDGKAINEGDVQVGGFSPYPISYRSIVPREAECTNLLVPVCLSATHIAYGSIRMEPVFMVLGQSAATAASLAIDGKTTVQKVDYGKLKERLLADKQVLAWTGPTARGRDPGKLAGLVLDDSRATIKGDWTNSSAIDGFVGAGYRHDGNAGKGDKSARFEFQIEKPGRYEVRVAYTANPNRATNVPVTVVSADGEKLLRLNQRHKPTKDGFQPLGTFRFEKSAKVTISSAATDGYVIIDAVQLVPSRFEKGTQLFDSCLR